MITHGTEEVLLQENWSCRKFWWYSWMKFLWGCFHLAKDCRVTSEGSTERLEVWANAYRQLQQLQPTTLRRKQRVNIKSHWNQSRADTHPRSQVWHYSVCPVFPSLTEYSAQGRVTKTWLSLLIASTYYSRHIQRLWQEANIRKRAPCGSCAWKCWK